VAGSLRTCARCNALSPAIDSFCGTCGSILVPPAQVRAGLHPAVAVTGVGVLLVVGVAAGLLLAQLLPPGSPHLEAPASSTEPRSSPAVAVTAPDTRATPTAAATPPTQVASPPEVRNGWWHVTHSLSRIDGRPPYSPDAEQVRGYDLTYQCVSDGYCAMDVVSRHWPNGRRIGKVLFRWDGEALVAIEEASSATTCRIDGSVVTGAYSAIATTKFRTAGLGTRDAIALAGEKLVTGVPTDKGVRRGCEPWAVSYNSTMTWHSWLAPARPTPSPEPTTSSPSLSHLAQICTINHEQANEDSYAAALDTPNMTDAGVAAAIYTEIDTNKRHLRTLRSMPSHPWTDQYQRAFIEFLKARNAMLEYEAEQWLASDYAALESSRAHQLRNETKSRWDALWAEHQELGDRGVVCP
jgi:hypothetical protein